MSNWILISGAGSGIGRATAQTLARERFRLLLLGRREQALQETRASLANRDRHKIIAADTRDAEALRAGLSGAGIEDLFAVVVSAGVGGENQYGPEDRWKEILDTNLTGTYLLVNEALPYLNSNREDNGGFRHVVVISSILARLGVPGYTAYCASKAGLLGLTRSWAKTLAPSNILVNALCPGWVNTAMATQGLEAFAQGAGQTLEQALSEQMSFVPLNKMSEPEEIAALVHFLLSGRQNSMTGQTIDINNGAEMP